MKSSGRLLSVLVAVQALGIPPPLPAQERVTLRDGTVRVGSIAGVSGGAVQLRVGAATVALPLGNVSAVEMGPPAALAGAATALAGGKADQALAVIGPLAGRYKGLPTGWAEQALALLGDAYAAAGDLEKAAAAYEEIRTLYKTPTAKLRADIGDARVALARKNAGAAAKLLDPVADRALKDQSVSKTESVLFAQAFYLLGQVREAQQKYPEALASYLRAATIFHHDRAVAGAAQSRADALRKERAIVAP